MHRPTRSTAFNGRFGAEDRAPTRSARIALDEADVALLRTDSAPQGFGYDTGWGSGIELTLAPGMYVFMVPGPNGTVPGEPPTSVTVLTVQP